MSKWNKLSEAKYFLLMMNKEINNRHFFVFNLSAFLSSARSVLQYSYNEVDPTKNTLAAEGAKGWYDLYMSNNDILGFFRDKRDMNIHFSPIQPSAHYADTIIERINISDSVEIKVIRQNGEIETMQPPNQDAATQPDLDKREPHIIQEVKYFFKDWQGKEDVVLLAEMYIQEIEKFLQEGTRSNYLS